MKIYILGKFDVPNMDGTIKFAFQATILLHAVLMTAYCYALVARWAIQAPWSL